MQFNPQVHLLKDEGAYRVLAAAQALEKQGHNVVHLEIGQPSFPTPAWVATAGVEAIQQGFTKYTNPSGVLELKQAIAKHFSQTRHVVVSHDSVVVGPGAKPGLWFGVSSIVTRLDEVLLPDPGFPSYENMIKQLDCIPVRYNALAVDLAQELASKITLKTKAIILNSPSNPTGRVYTKLELEQVAIMLHQFPHVWIVSDEIYCHLTYEEDHEKEDPNTFPTCPSIASFPGMLNRTLVVDGFSKTFQMTGWRLGFVICPPTLAERLHLLMTHAVGCTASFTQKAGIVALEHPQAAITVRHTVEEYKRRRDYVVKRLNDMPGVECEPPAGAFYAFAKIIGGSARELCDKCLNQGHVAILPGGDFGQAGEEYIRISYVGDMDVLKEGLDRMERVILDEQDEENGGCVMV
ncbi:hypothetical protein BASA81_000698 [Batrachochytrium salamandrivorans]|nr:hypothetical protein BASA81_000698 [Batrachochytrium salamandrivorans]